MTPLCIYHKNCADGFGAAWVVHRALKSNVEFFAATYGDQPPEIKPGQAVYIVDFSYPSNLIFEMAAIAGSITILDHHVSAKRTLMETDLPGNVNVTFDLNHSGAMIAWNHFFPLIPPPPLLERIEDRDLWAFKFPDTKAVSAALFSYPYDFTTWGLLFSLPISGLAAEGESILRKQKKDIAELLAEIQYEMIIDNYCVPVANLPYIFASEAANEMCKGKPFAACYYDTGAFRVFSLRSDKEGLDVSEIARKFGGGGHVHAAGFRVMHELLPTLLPQS
jgi:oligoribonuclease NrnB/cAMP/cGMP phosphodiesterase (DHH superfamily)